MTTTEKAREDTLRRLENRLTSTVGRNPNEAEKYREVIRQNREEREGAFRPLLQDPLFLAFALPFGGVSGILVLERFLSRVDERIEHEPIGGKTYRCRSIGSPKISRSHVA